MARRPPAICKTIWKATKKARMRIQIRKTRRKLSTKRVSTLLKMEPFTADNGLAGSAMEQGSKPGLMELVTRASG